MSEPTPEPGPEPPGLRHRVRGALPWSLGIALLQIVLSLVGMLLLVRYLAPREYGVWALLLAAGGIIHLFISFGNHYYISRFIPARTDLRGVADEVWAIVTRRLLVTGAVSLALVFGFGFYAERFELTDYFPHVVVYQVALVLNIGCMYLDLALRARFLQQRILIISLGVQLLIVGGTAIGIVQGQSLMYFVVLVGAAAVLNFLAFAHAFGSTHGFPSVRALIHPPPQSAEAKSYRRATYTADFGVAFLHTDIGRYLIGYLTNNVQVALYAVAATIFARLQQLLPRTLFHSLLDATFFSRFEQTGDTAELNRMFRFIFKANLIAVFHFLALFAPLGQELIILAFREEYLGAYGAVLVFLLAMSFTTMPVDMTLMALKESRILVYAQAPLVLNIGLGIPLVLEFGATGMAAATSLSAVLKNTIMFLYARRKMEIRLPWGAVARCGLAMVLTAGLLHATTDVMGPGLGLLVGSVVYLGLIRILQPLNEDERRLLIAMLPNRLHPAVRIFLGPTGA